jgi:hypothetical protein
MPDNPVNGVWPAGGHMCMWYGNSWDDGGESPDCAYALNEVAREAYN